MKKKKKMMMMMKSEREKNERDMERGGIFICLTEILSGFVMPLFSFFAVSTVYNEHKLGFNLDPSIKRLPLFHASFYKFLGI